MTFAKLRRISVSLLIAAVLVTAALPTPQRFPFAATQTHVWGAKPVLEYFLLTAGLSDLLKAEVGLTEAEFEGLRQVALREAGELTALRQGSQGVVQDPRLTLRQKRDWVAQNGYNLRVKNIVGSSRQSVQEILDLNTYTRLVEWIETRWQVEQELHTSQAVDAGARSYKIYATRYDSNGSYTVAIPDKCVKMANGGAQKCSGYEYGQNYSVKIQYEGNSPVKVTVGESGPWNVDDNFWSNVGDPQPRRMFTDLPLGMPEAQAAYLDDYNGGLDQFGRQVTSPVAIDLAKQVSLDIGLQPGQNAWVDVTFLWTEGWQTQDVQEVTVNSPSNLQPDYFNDMCGSAWHKIPGFSGAPAYLTLNVDSQSESTNSAEWVPDLPVEGEYRVEAFVPDHAPVDWQCPDLQIPRDSSDARYTIIHANGTSNASGNQAPLANQWLELGTFAFNAGTAGKVKLADLNGEQALTRTISFSAVRFVLVNPPDVTPAPTPTPTPTPPPPDPTLQTGSSVSSPQGSVTIPFQALFLRGLSIGAATIDIQYDPAVILPTGCQADPGQRFTASACDLMLERDGLDKDSLRLTLSSMGGVQDSVLLAAITFQAVGSPGAFSTLDITPVAISDPGGAQLPLRESTGLICIAPCLNLWYMPFISRAQP